MSAIFRDDRKREFLNSDGQGRPLKSPVSTATIYRARRYRLDRLRAKMREHNCSAMLLYDPKNIRYALDCSNMQVWTLHNATRYALIFADGPVIMFEFKGCEHLCKGLDAIDEIRIAKSWLYMHGGDRLTEKADHWSNEIAELMRLHAAEQRLAVDRLDGVGANMLQAKGITLVEGSEIAESARSIKSDDEIEMMRWTIRVCEAGMARVFENSLPGITEQELWAHLHFENARSGGDWLETKLLTCGPNTNPWYNECSDRPCKQGEMIAFDTDMIGPYGYCADLSRSWTCGYTKMSAKQRDLYATALEQINHNMEIIKDGVEFADFNERSWKIPARHEAYRYSVAVHGVGVADEWPVILLHPDFEHNHGGFFEKNMVVCVESLIAEEGSESVKLETQVLITDNGVQRLDQLPWEDV